MEIKSLANSVNAYQTKAPYPSSALNNYNYYDKL